jgi:hypothetical protein
MLSSQKKMNITSSKYNYNLEKKIYYLECYEERYFNHNLKQRLNFELFNKNYLPKRNDKCTVKGHYGV